MEATGPTQPVRPGDREGPPTDPGTAARPDPHERIDGLRAWLAQLDRRLGIRTYALAAAAILALAAGIVAIVLALQVRDDTDRIQRDVDALRTRLGIVNESAARAAENEVQSLGDRLDALQARIDSVGEQSKASERRLQVAEDDIDDLRRQIADLRSSGGGGAAVTTTTTTTTTSTK